MIPPIVSYITFNRLGLTARNLKAILDTNEDFHMHIIDNHSSDGTWEYIKSLKDSRIITKTKLEANIGKIYALNLNLIKRQPGQYFITVDNDVYIETKDWISRFMKVFKAFPKVGLLGVKRGEPYGGYLPPVLYKEKGEASYLELVGQLPSEGEYYVPGHLQCLRPKLIDKIGYWSEENYFGDIEMSYRVNNYTSFKSGFVTDINIDQKQHLPCNKCLYQDKCKLKGTDETCFSIYKRVYKNPEFFEKFRWKYIETVRDMESGARPVYCASASDANSMENHIFNKEWAIENFKFYVENASW